MSTRNLQQAAVSEIRPQRTFDILKYLIVENEVPWWVDYSKIGSKTLQDQIPKAWIYFNNNDYILSLYQLNINSENTYISAYFRCYLLYSNKIEDIKSYDVYDFNGNKYLDLDERKYKITETFIKPVFLICFKWCIEVLHTFKYYYSFNYILYYL